MRHLSVRGGFVWTPISARDFGYTVRSLSLGLNALGIQPGDRVAILSENRPEWAMADYAILCAGAWTVPIYPTLPAQQIVPLLKDSGANAVFVSNLEQLGKIMQVKAQCPALDHVISMLDPNGVLVCAVPNFRSLAVRLLGVRDNACVWVPEHVN